MDTSILKIIAVLAIIIVVGGLIYQTGKKKILDQGKEIIGDIKNMRQRPLEQKDDYDIPNIKRHNDIEKDENNLTSYKKYGCKSTGTVFTDQTLYPGSYLPPLMINSYHDIDDC